MYSVLLLLGCIVIYGAPTLIARSRNASERRKIEVWNLLLGWTVLGWFGCLIWAVVSPVDGLRDPSTQSIPRAMTSQGVWETTPRARKAARVEPRL